MLIILYGVCPSAFTLLIVSYKIVRAKGQPLHFLLFWVKEKSSALPYKQMISSLASHHHHSAYLWRPTSWIVLASWYWDITTDNLKRRESLFTLLLPRPNYTDPCASWSCHSPQWCEMGMLSVSREIFCFWKHLSVQHLQLPQSTVSVD